MSDPKNASKNPSDTVSALAHRLRTPLTVLMSTVNNLLDGAFGRLSDEQRKWIQKLEVHTTSLESLLNETLNLLRELSGSKAKLTYQDASGAHPAPIAERHPSDADLSAADDAPMVLAIDDEPDILDVIQEGLASKGIRVTTLSDGEEAVDLAMRLKPDLILMDVLIGNQNGFDICRSIKSRMDTFTPVIFITGQDDLRIKVSGKAQMADDLLTKPFSLEELFARVKSMIRLKRLNDDVIRLKREIKTLKERAA
jgi:PleD family two-component response regulator